ncbi:avidin-related protein 4/5-like [Hyperolius riggenbachi]|uniref:avidin-related protein 4/5-like n=1 Tax=Hyperolius riggenbachi TaxID=752182 RepID=UPI0035A36FFB
MVSLLGVQRVLLCVFVLSCSCSDVQGAECNMTGVWINTLGSVLTLHADGGSLSGSLHTTVEQNPGAAGGDMTGKLMGVLGKGKQPTFAMSVRWHKGSVTAWVGQCFIKAGCPILRTVWLLRSEETSEGNNWKATRVGEDIFYAQKKCDNGGNEE